MSKIFSGEIRIDSQGRHVLVQELIPAAGSSVRSHSRVRVSWPNHPELGYELRAYTTVSMWPRHMDIEGPICKAPPNYKMGAQ